MLGDGVVEPARRPHTLIGFSSAWAASRGRRALVVIVCLGVAWVGVGDAAVSADSGVELGLSQARPIPLVSLSGERVRLGQILGDQLPRDGVVILVWSMYQPDSRRALRAVDQISGEFSSPSSDIVFVAVEIPEYRESPQAVAAFVSKARVALPVYLDPTGRVFEALAELGGGQGTLPETYHILENGTVRTVYTGWADAYPDRVERQIRRNLAGK